MYVPTRAHYNDLVGEEDAHENATLSLVVKEQKKTSYKTFFDI